MKDLHTHTCFCDGKDSPEAMVLSAIEKGLDTIGICAHSYTPFAIHYCLMQNRYTEFQEEVCALKEKYRDKIRVLCGIEQEYYSDAPTAGFDYVIGSVHYIRVGREYIPVDENAEILKKACQEQFSGNPMALAQAYYELVAKVVEKTQCDIIGHFDLLSKFDETDNIFDESCAEYTAAWTSAADVLLKSGKVFEVNTGAISRGYRTTPYPARSIAEYIKSKGGKLILSSDAHAAENIAYQFDKWKDNI